MPTDLVTPGDEVGLQFFRAAAVADVPLPRGDDLEGLVTLFEELHRVLQRARFADQVPGLAQELDHLYLGPASGLARDSGVCLLRPVGGEPRWGLGLEATVPCHARTGRQVEFAPPGHIGGIAERADHGDAGSLVGFGKFVGQDGDLDPEHRCADVGPEQRLVAVVVGVGDECHTADDEFGPRRVDDDRFGSGGAVFVDRPEGERVVGPGAVAVLELCLCHRGLERHVPEAGCLARIGLSPRQIAEEGALGDPTTVFSDGRVGAFPIDRQPEMAPGCLEGLLVDRDQLLAELDEVGSADGHEVVALLGRFLRRRETVGIGNRRVTQHAVVVLHPPFGRQAVVVPTHRVEHGLAGHPLVAGDRIGVGVGEDVSHVE